jgi:hypothetical protein
MRLEYCPEGQFLHDAEPVVEILPAAQLMHATELVCPVLELNLPAAQLVQAVAPAAA